MEQAAGLRAAAEALVRHASLPARRLGCSVLTAVLVFTALDQGNLHKGSAFKTDCTRHVVSLLGWIITLHAQLTRHA